MKILIKQPLALYESGEQPLNQDFIFPLVDQANPEERLFIICDGEGGTQAGDVASKLVALSIAKFFASTPPQGAIDQMYLDQALHAAEKSLSAYKESHAESQNMRTSLALLHLGEEQATLAWVGSCRVYYFDQKTQSLKIAGSEPGTTEASSTISGSELPAQIHFKYVPVAEIGPADYFFLASDGMLEQVDAQTLESLFKPGAKVSAEFLMNEIRNLTQGFTRDNYSAYLVQVEKVSDPTVEVIADLTGGAVPTGIRDAEPEVTAAGSGSWVRNAMFFLVLMLFVSLVLVAWFYSRPKGYDAFMAKGDAMMAKENYSDAVAMYDSAIAHAPDPNLSDLAVGQRTKAIAMMDQDTPIDPNVDLSETAEAYADRGNEFFENKNYLAAIKAYRQAEIAKEQQNDNITVIPKDKMAEAYIQLGNQYYEEKDRNCKNVLEQYELAFDLFQSPELNVGDQQIVTLALERADECNKLLGQGPSESMKLLAAAQASGGSGGTNSRSVNPASSSQDANDASKGNLTALGDDQNKSSTPSSISTSPSTTTTNPTARVSSPQNRVAPQTENLTTRSLDPAKEVDMKRRLSDGKRLFVQAKDSESGYQYRISAENLEFAEPVLDGSGAYMLAYLYHMGLAGEKDVNKALKYAQRSAKLNWAPGQYLYGHLLLEREYPRDTVTAVQVLEKAANQNYLKAIERLSAIR